MTMLGREEVRWTDRDRMLALALEYYENHFLCPGCGQPRERAYHLDQEGFYDAVDDTVCYACAAVHEKTHATGYKPKPGAKLHIVDGRPADRPLRELT